MIINNDFISIYYLSELRHPGGLCEVYQDPPSLPSVTDCLRIITTNVIYHKPLHAHTRPPILALFWPQRSHASRCQFAGRQPLQLVGVLGPICSCGCTSEALSVIVIVSVSLLLSLLLLLL